jgi:hypothetical protein
LYLNTVVLQLGENGFKREEGSETLFFGSTTLHCIKKLSFFPSPAGMSLTKLSLAGNNLIIPGQEEFVIEQFFN